MKSSSRRKVSEPVMEMFLRIKHPTLDTASITEALGMEPEECIDVGASASRSGGQRLHSESYWIARLDVPSLAELATNFTSLSASNIFSHPGKTELKNIIGASEHDIFILVWLKRLENQRSFFAKLNQAGGSATLLLQRNDLNSPIVLRRSFGKLDELGIGVEID